MHEVPLNHGLQKAKTRLQVVQSYPFDCKLLKHLTILLGRPHSNPKVLSEVIFDTMLVGFLFLSSVAELQICMSNAVL